MNLPAARLAPLRQQTLHVLINSSNVQNTTSNRAICTAYLLWHFSNLNSVESTQMPTSKAQYLADRDITKDLHHRAVGSFHLIIIDIGTDESWSLIIHCSLLIFFDLAKDQMPRQW
jgi:hypothetical protein